MLATLPGSQRRPRAFAMGCEPGFAAGQFADLAAARNSDGATP